MSGGTSGGPLVCSLFKAELALILDQVVQRAWPQQQVGRVPETGEGAKVQFDHMMSLQNMRWFQKIQPNGTQVFKDMVIHLRKT